MRENLRRWIRDASALQQMDILGTLLGRRAVDYVADRSDDYFLSLVGELFDRLRAPYDESVDWSRLGAALGDFTEGGAGAKRVGHRVSTRDASLFAASAFYCGGYSASAYLFAHRTLSDLPSGHGRDCIALLARRPELATRDLQALSALLSTGDVSGIEEVARVAQQDATSALENGPDDWISAELRARLLERLARENIRAVLPEGTLPFWNPLISSFLAQSPPVWEFFPSQRKAIDDGLLARSDAFVLQMPTGAGKTAITETLLFSHLERYQDDVAVLLVPLRALAYELRRTLALRLGRMGLRTRCAYGGTVPSRSESTSLQRVRVVIATPEALVGLISVDGTLLHRIGLVICDEGHLLGSPGRGILLELLLARFKARLPSPPRFVFVSAIVPNAEEIGAWLGGESSQVSRSEYRPAALEYAVLRSNGSGRAMSCELVMHPQDDTDVQYALESFLTAGDFQVAGARAGRTRTYPYSSFKTRAVAVARKLLPMGTIALYAANKRGERGAIGLAVELSRQLGEAVPLPRPLDFARREELSEAVEYFSFEFGAAWIGTNVLSHGAALHHGDLLQEHREVLEKCVSRSIVKFAICTSTLAEGVNLPIRALVLYSVRRQSSTGGLSAPLRRDVKNLVGRAGRAGSTTKGLVVCVNPDDWEVVRPVALDEPVELLRSALVELLRELLVQIAVGSFSLPKTHHLHARSRRPVGPAAVQLPAATALD